MDALQTFMPIFRDNPIKLFLSLPIWYDNPISIYNDLKPQRWHSPVTDTWPGFVVIIIFTIVHFILDILIDPRARSYAEQTFKTKQQSQQSLMKRPKWMPTSLETELSSIHSTKSLTDSKLTKLIKKHKISVKNPKPYMILYHKQLSSIGKNVSKFKEAFFKVIVFGIVYFYGLCIIFTPPFNKFFLDYTSTCSGWPQSPGDVDGSIFNLNNYYWLQIGYHGHRAIYQFFEHSRKDFMAMFIHHWVTLMLLVGSYAAGYQQTGSIVLLCNDNVDLLMPVAKLADYFGYKRLSTIGFVSFALLWIPCRVVLYGVKVLGPLMGCAYYVTLRPYAWHWLLFWGLSIIYALQWYWTKFLLAMLYRKIFIGGKAVDTRSEDEDDGQSGSGGSSGGRVGGAKVGDGSKKKDM